MKRSRSIELALMGTVPLLLAACDQAREPPRSALLYQSLQQCISEAKVSVDVCRTTYEQALEAQERLAPRYGSFAECAQQFGDDQCRQVVQSSGDHWFMPALAGFLIGRALDTNRGPGYVYGWNGRPIYRTRTGREVWGAGAPDRFGGVRGPEGYSVAETLSRGGFGYSSAARASWGG
jgi:uncharacterized protein YgiB involved in biofilm formation